MIRYAILALLREQSDYGYGLKQRFERSIGSEWRLNIGQVYQVLKEMEQRGLVHGSTEARGPKRVRRVYTITPAGERQLGHWERRPPVRRSIHRDELLLKLMALGPECPEEALRHVRHQCRQVREHLAELEREPAEERSWLRELSVQAVRLQLEAEADWLARCRDALERQRRSRTSSAA